MKMNDGSADGSCGKYRIQSECRLGPAADKADESDDHDQRSGGGFAERQSVDHLRCRQPLIMVDCALVDIRQYRIGATERHQCCLGEKPSHLRKRALQAEL
jgi:hypothetical protein